MIRYGRMLQLDGSIPPVLQSIFLPGRGIERPLDLLVDLSMPLALLEEVSILPLALLVEVMMHLSLVGEIPMMPLQMKVDHICHSSCWT